MFRLRVFLIILAVILAAYSLPGPDHCSGRIPLRKRRPSMPLPQQSRPTRCLPRNSNRPSNTHAFASSCTFVETGWGILQLILLLALGVAARMRNVAVNVSKNRWVQGFTFTFLLLFITSLLNLPLEMVRTPRLGRLRPIGTALG